MMSQSAVRWGMWAWACARAVLWTPPGMHRGGRPHGRGSVLFFRVFHCQELLGAVFRHGQHVGANVPMLGWVFVGLFRFGEESLCAGTLAATDITVNSTSLVERVAQLEQ